MALLMSIPEVQSAPGSFMQGMEGAQMGALQRKLMQQKVKFTPLQYALQGAKQSQTSSRFGPAYQLYRTLMAWAPADRAKWIANHQEAWNNIVNKIANQALQTGQQQGIVKNLMQQYFPGMAQAPGGAPPSPISAQTLQAGQTLPQALTDQGLPGVAPQQGLPPAAPQQAPQGMPGMPGAPQGLPGALGMAQPQPGAPFVSTPKQLQEQRDIGQLVANQKLSSAAVNRRAQNAVFVENWVNKNRDEYAGRINKLLSYAGPKGMSKRYLDSWLNKNPDKASDYDWYTGTFMVGLTNAIRRMEGMGATDQQKKELQGMANQVDKILTNPKRAKMALNKMFSTFQDISDSTFVMAEPSNKGVYRKMYKLPRLTEDYLGNGKAQQRTYTSRSGKKYSMADIQETARKYGETPDDVINKAGLK